MITGAGRQASTAESWQLFSAEDTISYYIPLCFLSGRVPECFSWFHNLFALSAAFLKCSVATFASIHTLPIYICNTGSEQYYFTLSRCPVASHPQASSWPAGPFGAAFAFDVILGCGSGHESRVLPLSVCTVPGRVRSRLRPARWSATSLHSTPWRAGVDRRVMGVASWLSRSPRSPSLVRLDSPEGCLRVSASPLFTSYLAIHTCKTRRQHSHRRRAEPGRAGWEGQETTNRKKQTGPRESE